MSAGSLPEGIVPSGTPERDNDSLYGTPKEEVGPNAQAIHFQGNRERVCDSENTLYMVFIFLRTLKSGFVYSLIEILLRLSTAK